MNTSVNRNRWAVTEKSMNEGAPSIKGKPIGSGKDYTLGHFPAEDSMDHGQFSGYEIPSSYMTATATIKDDKVWGLLESGEWGPISVVIQAYAVSCSECGKDIMDEGLDHKHVQDNEAHANVDSYKFDRVDFVGDPAYPQAGLMDMSSDVSGISPQLTLAANYYEGKSQSNKNGSQGTQGKSRGKRKMSAEEFKELQDKLDAKTKEIETLTTRITTMEGQRHTELVIRVAEARFNAKLCKDLEEEKKALMNRSDADLGLLLADAKIFEARLDELKPKAKDQGGPGDPDDEDTSYAAFDAVFKKSKKRLYPNPEKLMARALGEERKWQLET